MISKGGQRFVSQGKEKNPLEEERTISTEEEGFFTGKAFLPLGGDFV
jgi:hypothetical protein